jgi:cytochrome c-type biogenesis protein CcmH/NrfF
MQRFLSAPRVIAALSLLCCVSFGGVLFAQPHGSVDPAPSRGTGDVSVEVAQKAAAIARQTMSPFCPGRTLSDCPSEYATEWRRDIRQMVAEGKSATEIQDELESRAAGNLSGIPNNQSSYAIPVGLALVAGVVLYFVFARLSRGVGGSGSSSGRSHGNAPKERSKSAPHEASDERLQDELDNEI